MERIFEFTEPSAHPDEARAQASLLHQPAYFFQSEPTGNVTAQARPERVTEPEPANLARLVSLLKDSDDHHD